MISQRYEGIVDGYNEYVYHILGCGAIGSAAATQVARMGAMNIHLYDMDTVDVVNIGVSIYGHVDIDKPKVDALANIIRDINPECRVTKHNERFDQHQVDDKDDKEIVVVGFDSMDSRKYAIENVLKKKKPYLLIDGRMGAEHYQQYSFKSPTLRSYMKTWYSDDEGSVDPCNAKATSYCSNMSGSFICNTIKKVINEEPYQESFSFNFPTMMLNYRGFTT